MSIDAMAGRVADEYARQRGIEPPEDRLEVGEMLRLAKSGVHKVDLLGPRGTTLCTMNEIEAMACCLVTLRFDHSQISRPAEGEPAFTSRRGEKT